MGNLFSKDRERAESTDQKSDFMKMEEHETKCNKEMENKADESDAIQLRKATDFKNRAQESKEHLEAVAKDPNIKDFIGIVLGSTPSDISSQITKFEDSVDTVKLRLKYTRCITISSY